MAKITARLFETGTITGNDGFNTIVGTPTIDTSSKMKGLNCARTNWTASANVNGVVSGLTATEFWIQFYFNVAAYPAASSRVVQSSNGNTQWNITMGTAGAMNLRNNATTIATTFMTASLNTTYRIGIHFKAESTFGANDGILELWHATGDNAFGSADYSNTAYNMNATATAISSVNFGQSNGTAATGDIYWDDIRIDSTAMPATAGSLLDDLMGYWKLEEASGNRLDELGVLTLSDNNSVTQTTGKQGNAAFFTLANQEYLSRADGTALSAGNINVSWGVWVKMTSKPAGNASIIAKWNYSGTQREYTVGYDGTTDRFYLQVSLDGTNTGATKVDANNLGSPSTGTWYFIVASHNAGSDLLSISVNDGTANTASHTTGIFDGTSNFNIGAMNNGTDLWWDGAIDEVGMWKRILTSTEITFLYNSGSGRTYPFSANTDTPKAVNVTVTSTLTFGPKVVGKPISVAVTTTKTIVRAISLINALIVTLAVSAIKAKPILVALAVSSAATIQKTVGKPISVAISNTIARLTAYGKNITRTVTSTVTLTKELPKIVSVSVSNAITITKNIAKPIAYGVTGTIAFLKGLVTLKTISYAVTSTIAFTKGIVNVKLITYAVTSTVAFAKGMVNLKTITLAVTSTVPRALKNVGKPVLRTVTSTISRITNIPHNVLVSVTGIVSLRRDIAKNISRAVTSTVTGIAGKGYFRNATVVVSSSLLTLKNILKPIAINESIVVSLLPKAISKTITRAVTSVVSATAGRAFFRAINVVSTVIISRKMDIAKIVSIVQNSVTTVQKSFTLLIIRTVNVPIVLSVQKGVLITRSYVVNSFVTFSKLLANVFTNTYFRKNRRALTLGLKNTTLSVLGKNTRTIDLQDTNES